MRVVCLILGVMLISVSSIGCEKPIKEVRADGGPVRPAPPPALPLR